MSQICVSDPLGAATVCSQLRAEIEGLGYFVTVSDSLGKLNETRIQVRGKQVSPFFDATVCNLPPDKFFWMHLSSPSGIISGLQAFRYDCVDTSLADWGPNLTIGLAMRRQELMIPAQAAPPKNSIAERIRGKLIFHGEFWIDPQVRNRKVMEKFSRLGIVLTHIKWNPDSVWALASSRMAERGQSSRMGYTYNEKGFLRWQWATEGIDLDEWLVISERSSIEQMISEMLTAEDCEAGVVTTGPQQVPARMNGSRAGVGDEEVRNY